MIHLHVGVGLAGGGTAMIVPSLLKDLEVSIATRNIAIAVLHKLVWLLLQPLVSGIVSARGVDLPDLAASHEYALVFLSPPLVWVVLHLLDYTRRTRQTRKPRKKASSRTNWAVADDAQVEAEAEPTDPSREVHPSRMIAGEMDLA
jgi:hypothetical protein